MKNTFKKEDFNSPDGMLTSVWGPSLWHSLHAISFNYPTKPNLEQKKNYLDFFKSLKTILPCKYCRINFVNNLKVVPLNMKTMKNRESLSKWLYNLHEEINKMLGKTSNLTYENVRERYEMFRSRCLDDTQSTTRKSKKIIERGCTTPYYGKKSRCVINIVPKSNKCKTFKIDRKCIIKRGK
jgi:hypothetical protein